MHGKWGVSVCILFSLLALALPISGNSQITLEMPARYVKNQSITGSVIITLTVPIPDNSTLDVHMGGSLASSRSLSPYLYAVKPYSYPTRPFNYTITASGNIVTYSDQGFDWTITANGTRITGEPWSVQRSGSGHVSGLEGLRHVTSMADEGVTYPSDISGDTSWSVTDSSPGVTTVMREACGFGFYNGMQVNQYGWVINRTLGEAGACEKPNCLQENEYMNCWCGMLGSTSVTGIEPFDKGSLSEGSGFPTGEETGGIYKDGVRQDRPQDVEWEHLGAIYVSDKDNSRIARLIIENSTWDTIGSYGSGDWQLNLPHEIFYDVKNDYVYIADYGNNRIVRARMDGSSWVAYGSPGSGTGQFNAPVGLYVYPPTGYIYVSDTNNHRIVRTSIVGTGWLALGSGAGSGAGQFRNPHGIHYDGDSGYLYIADTQNHRIVRTKMDGSGWESYGSPGSGTGQFNYPTGIYHDKFSGYIYIGDSNNHRVVRTKMDGSGWESYGSLGSGTRQFNRPHTIYYDNQTGMIYATDALNNRIVRFKWDGTYWETLGTGGSGAWQFNFPVYLATDYAENIMVDEFNTEAHYTINYFPPNGDRLCAYTSVKESQPWSASITTGGNSCRYMKSYQVNYTQGELEALLGIPANLEDLKLSVTTEPPENLKASLAEKPGGGYTLTVYTDSQEFSSPVNISVGLDDMNMTSPEETGDYSMAFYVKYGPDIYFSETGAFGVCPDGDRDGYAPEGSGCRPEDCNDSDASIRPGVYDVPNNGIDENCDGIDGITDLDGDGFNNTYENGTILDCDDSSPGVNPNASEACNGIDDNCNGITDDVLGGNSTETTRCRCFEGSPVTETCNGIDDDCDGAVDGMTMLCSADRVGECGAGSETCTLGIWSGCAGPAAEVCDGRDNDCDGETDEGVKNTCTDYSTCATSETCSPCPAPPAEACNGIDDNCNGEADEGFLCISGDTRACNTNLGVCVEGSHTCTGCSWGSCEGSYGPFEEICGNGLDDDCDGEADEHDCIRDANIPCAYGQIYESCRCGERTYSFGYCCNGEWGLKKCPGFDIGDTGTLLIIGGAAIMAALGILFFHFRRKGRELTWEELYKRWRK